MPEGDLRVGLEPLPDKPRSVSRQRADERDVEYCLVASDVRGGPLVEVAEAPRAWRELGGLCVPRELVLGKQVGKVRALLLSNLGEGAMRTMEHNRGPDCATSSAHA